MPLGTVWSHEEDQRLADLVQLHGPKKWSQIASELGTSKGSKQCRRRWKNFLSLDDRKLGSWTAEEDAQLLECHRKHGNKWTLIAQEIGGRTDNAVKNRWAALEKKRHIDDAGYLEQQHRASYSRGGGDLLGVRRIIAKDQPQRSYTSRQQGMLEAAYWMQEGYAAAAAAAAAAEQQDQGMYGMQMAALGSQQGGADSSMLLSKPDLRINIPGATAELPYSQRFQAAGPDPSRPKAEALTPGAAWLGSELHGMDQGKGEDDALLSTSRQGAQAAMAGLATPTEEPSALSELYKFLYGATPAAQQLAAAGVGAAAAAAAAGQLGAPGLRREPPKGQSAATQQMQQQQLPMSLPPPAGLYLRQQQLQSSLQQQQQVYPPSGPMLGSQDMSAVVVQPQPLDRLVPPPSSGMPYSQPLCSSQPQAHSLSKLSRTVSSLEVGPHAAAMPQPSLPDSMMLRQQLVPPAQPRFVPQGPPSSSGMAGSVLVGHSGAAVTTAAGGFQPGRPGPQLPSTTASGSQQPQPNMLQRQQQMPVGSQGQPALPQFMPQGPLLPPQAVPQGPPPPAPCAPQPQQQQQWGAEELRQLLDILGEAAVNEGQQQLPTAPLVLPAVADKLEHANNVTGSVTAAV